jgi:hypothetical protein
MVKRIKVISISKGKYWNNAIYQKSEVWQIKV